MINNLNLDGVEKPPRGIVNLIQFEDFFCDGQVIIPTVCKITAHLAVKEKEVACE